MNSADVSKVANVFVDNVEKTVKRFWKHIFETKHITSKIIKLFMSLIFISIFKLHAPKINENGSF